MDVNVASIVRAMLKDSQPGDAKALELRVGQIVRGVLLEILDNQEALININGMPVRAKLDADLPVGQGTLLQVQPQAKGGLVSLKPLADPTAAQAEASVRESVKAFGLPDQRWSFELLSGLKRDGYPTGRETAQWFAQAGDAMPPGEDAERWMNAAGVAFRRGLPPTETTIASLRQALYGPPLHEQLRQMAAVVEASLAEMDPSSETAQAAGRVGRLLADGMALLARGGEALWTDGPQEPAGGRSAGGELPREAATAAGQRAQGEAQQTAASPASRAAGPAAAAAAMPAAGQAYGGASPAPQAPLGAGSAADGAAKGNLAAKAAESAAPDSESAAAGARAGADTSAHAGRTAAAGTADRKDGAWIERFLQWLGTGHERHAVTGAGGPGAETPNAGPGQPGQPAPTGDTLKGALLALAAMDDAPPALKEAAQGLAQQITGQQLLLSAERQNTAMMSHMTLFIPLRGQDGDTTATVRVETRRGRKGEWDASNCRLLFDLKMRHLGDTLVDVQVVDKAVSLRLLNDRPWVAELVEAARGEAAAGLQEAGYRLLSLTAAPYPKPAELGTGGEAPEAGAAPPRPELAGTAAYAAKPYRGVDYRA
ncbi:hypothetical protein [Cohnella sp. REN36]|uniref:hypothetical protein n=1 Tax=Cohnella sp. REN36 TaxID=2887347 RepID=UPI001D13D64E|nr:hypothetical protein [Cohnella sp. REN36]MCC3376257.1 hypothetical protein [Cohnella sp. REN36]